MILFFSLITINVAVNQNEKNANLNVTYVQNETQNIDDNKTQEDIGNAWIEGKSNTGESQ